MQSLRCVALLAGVVVYGCDAGRGGADPVGPRTPAFAQAGGADLAANGGGRYEIPGLIVQFSLTATQGAAGTAGGEFRQRVDIGGGLVVDFHGRVTCLAVDPAQHRAWIGGVVTVNASTDPDFQLPIHAPGRDVWFRVVDYGSGGAAPPDRTTFLGFEGAAGIITSADYCAARIWPAADARTWPVTGNLTVAP
jgi:hypothetical protein